MLYILDYGAGNVASLGELPCNASRELSELTAPSHRSANSVRALGFDFKWVETVEDIEKADVSSSRRQTGYCDCLGGCRAEWEARGGVGAISWGGSWGAGASCSFEPSAQQSATFETTADLFAQIGRASCRERAS